MLAELARASELPRTLAPRLSIPVEFRACTLSTPPEGTIPQATCEAPSDPILPSRRILDLAARASAAVHARVDPEALHTAALIDLVWGGASGASLERSISYLQTASRLSDRPSPVLADLAAAYLVRAEANQNPRDLLQAVEAAQQALEREPQNAAARFNLALALDHAGLVGQAKSVWQAVISSEPKSRWTAEAEQRVAALGGASNVPDQMSTTAQSEEGERLVAQSPQDARIFGWERVLGEWGSAVLQGDSAAAAHRLALAGAIGDALVRQGGDASLADAVAVIRQSGKRLKALATAHRAYAEGRAALLVSDYEQADSLLQQAARFASSSDPLRSWTNFGRAATLARAARIEEAVPLARELVAHTDTARYRALAGHAHWVLGVIDAWQGNGDQADQSYAIAEELFARANEWEYRGAIQFLQAAAMFNRGNTAAAHAAMHQAARVLRPYQSSVWLHNVLSVWAERTLEEGAPYAALQIQSEGLSVSQRLGLPVNIAEAQIFQARILAALGKPGVEGNLARAEGTMRQIETGRARDWARAELRLAKAGVWRRDAPARALSSADSAVSFFERPRNPVRLLPALVSRAEMRLESGDVAGAERDLDAALTLVDRQQQALASVASRAMLLDAARRVIDRLVMLRVAAGHSRDALSYLERARVSLASVNNSRRPTSQKIALPAGEVALDYALIGDTLLIWTVNNGDVRLTRSEVSRAALTDAIQKTNASLELRASEAQARVQLATLYDLLIRPVESHLGPEGTPLVIVADGEVAAAPLPALLNRTSGRYLVETHPLRFAANLNDAARSQPSPELQRPSALLVADPAFDRRAHPGLDRLRGAEREIQLVAQAYLSPRVLTGAQADPATLTKALEQAGVVHYAGHAVFDDARPEQSHLVLATTENRSGQSGTLTAAQIRGLNLRATRLVVLSACQTARAGQGGSSGFAGLAGGFLAAGVGGVVGSLWRVDDELTRHLMAEFHSAYRQTGDAAAALRTAQLRLRRSTNPALRSPAAWGGFRYTGT
jgi:CHAT domain-containing protein